MNKKNLKEILVLIGLVVVGVKAFWPQLHLLGGTTNYDSLTLASNLTVGGTASITGISNLSGDVTIASTTVIQLQLGTSTQTTQIKCASSLFDPPSLVPGQSVGQDVALNGAQPSSSQVIWASFNTSASSSYLGAVGTASSSNVVNVVLTLPTSTILNGVAKNVQQGTINVCELQFSTNP